MFKHVARRSRETVSLAESVSLEPAVPSAPWCLLFFCFPDAPFFICFWHKFSTLNYWAISSLVIFAESSPALCDKITSSPLQINNFACRSWAVWVWPSLIFYDQLTRALPRQLWYWLSMALETLTSFVPSFFLTTQSNFPQSHCFVVAHEYSH